MEQGHERSGRTRGRSARIAGKAAYWLAVLILSLAMLVGLILLLESRDDSSVSGGAVSWPLPS